MRNDADMLLLVFTGCPPSLNLNGGTVWLYNTFTGYNPCAMSFGNCYEVADGCGPSSVTVFNLSGDGR
jgi:hypothetical protein